MSHLKLFLRRSKVSEALNDSHEEKDQTTRKEEDGDSPKLPKPARGWRRVIAIYKLYFPLGMYQRALEWHLDPVMTSVDKTNEVPKSKNRENTNEHKNGTEKEMLIRVKEKPFRSRFGYFSTRTILQSVGLSIVFTAPLSLPWIFNVVIPFSMDIFLPFGLADLVRGIIAWIINFFSPITLIIETIMVFSNVFGTYNPIFFYGSTLWLLKFLGITDIEVFENLSSPENQSSRSLIELLATQYQSKFLFIQNIIVPFLILVTGTISFFFIVRRARFILFEIQTEKGQAKTIEKIKETFISYYLDEGYSKVEYTENRIASDSPKMKWLAFLTKYGPIVSVLLPISMAIIFVVL